MLPHLFHLASDADASEPEDDTGIIATTSARPADVPGVTSGASGDGSARLPRTTGRVVIVRNHGYERITS